MVFQAYCKVNGLKTGKTNKGKDWYLVKFIDDDEKHFNTFVDGATYKKLDEGCSVSLLIDLNYDLKHECYNVKFVSLGEV